MKNVEKERIIDAFLFQSVDAINKKTLAETMEIDIQECEEILEKIKTKTEDRGYILLDDGVSVCLVIDPDIAPFFNKKDTQKKQDSLTPSMREILSLVAYAGPLSRVDIDIIRGVNSRYSVDRLIHRGYMQGNKKGNDIHIAITTDFLSSFGLKDITELPEYEKKRNTILSMFKNIKERIYEN